MIWSSDESDNALPVIGQDIETLSDSRTEQLKHLLELNHENYSILYNHNHFHNHSPHFLSSAYLYNGTSEYLQEIYDDIVTRDNMEGWEPSPGPITMANYRAHLGKGEYQRAYVDFFQEQIRQSEKDWKEVVLEFLLAAGPDGESNPSPMLYSLIAAVGHPLIHLGYAFELNSKLVAVEALGLIATCYDERLVKQFNLMCKDYFIPVKQFTPSDTCSALFEVFQNMHHNNQLPTFPQPGEQNVESVISDDRQTLGPAGTLLGDIWTHVSTWNSLTPPGPISHHLRQFYHLASLLLLATSPTCLPRSNGHDFFLVHLLTTIHAIRTLLPHFPESTHTTLLTQWLLLAAVVYTAQNRPPLDPPSLPKVATTNNPQIYPSYVTSIDIQGKDWTWVRTEALRSPYSMDAHFIKAVRALSVAGETFKDDKEWYLKCAVGFIEEFEGWGGFSSEGEDAQAVRRARIKDGIWVR